MKKLAIIAAATAALTSIPAFAQQIEDTQATGVATARVAGPLRLAHVDGAELSFGSFAPGTGGTVNVNRTGARSTTGNILLLDDTIAQADKFTVVGGANRNYQIRATPSEITHTDGSTTMKFTLNAPGGRNVTASGEDEFTVGGRLTVSANQKPGQYSGTYVVEVAYR